MSRTELPTLHFNIGIRLNEDSWSWNEPNTNVDMNFDIPLALFDPKTFATMIADKVKGLEKAFPEAVLEHERREAEKELETEGE